MPVALATDDPGVSRDDMTNQYMRAVQEQGLDYATLKRLARNSLEYSFAEGESLWDESRLFEDEAARARMLHRSPARRSSPRIRRRVSNGRLEQRLRDFEAKWK